MPQVSGRLVKALKKNLQISLAVKVKLGIKASIVLKH